VYLPPSAFEAWFVSAARAAYGSASQMRSSAASSCAAAAAQRET
jgi:hypothetical protein